MHVEHGDHLVVGALRLLALAPACRCSVLKCMQRVGFKRLPVEKTTHRMKRLPVEKTTSWIHSCYVTLLNIIILPSYVQYSIPYLNTVVNTVYTPSYVNTVVNTVYTPSYVNTVVNTVYTPSYVNTVYTRGVNRAEISGPARPAKFFFRPCPARPAINVL